MDKINVSSCSASKPTKQILSGASSRCSSSRESRRLCSASSLSISDKLTSEGVVHRSTISTRVVVILISAAFFYTKSAASPSRFAAGESRPLELRGFHLTPLMSNRHPSHHQKMSCRDWRQRRSMRVRCSRPAVVLIRPPSAGTWGFTVVSP
eukprot:scpid99409/ scgid6548/ 